MENGIFKCLKYVLDCILDVIYSSDNRCVLCKNYATNGLICEQCIRKVKTCYEKLVLDKENIKFKCYYTGYYSGVIKELILRLKYKGDFRCGKVISKFMINAIYKNNIDFDLVTYVPMRKENLVKRGYNQSKYLSKLIGNDIDKPMVSCLYKSRQTKDQIGLNGKERWKNVMDCFQVKNKSKVENKKILLVDDVLTTGATAFSCAFKLKKCGAKEVSILTYAKSTV